jgi:hypothetical protein
LECKSLKVEAREGAYEENKHSEYLIENKTRDIQKLIDAKNDLKIKCPNGKSRWRKFAKIDTFVRMTLFSCNSLRVRTG